MSTVSDYFGCMVFDDRVMKANLSADVYGKRPRPELFFRPDAIFSARKCADIKNMSIFAVPKRWFRGTIFKERCRSGRSGRTRNAVYGQLYRGFESLSLRQNTTNETAKPCKLNICRVSCV